MIQVPAGMVTVPPPAAAALSIAAWIVLVPLGDGACGIEIKEGHGQARGFWGCCWGQRGFAGIKGRHSDRVCALFNLLFLLLFIVYAARLLAYLSSQRLLANKRYFSDLKVSLFFTVRACETCGRACGQRCPRAGRCRLCSMPLMER